MDPTHYRFVCFNSTLVRFKLAEEYRFNPHRRVSIPLWFDSNGPLLEITLGVRRSFNSTLVRFKLRAERHDQHHDHQFQFHSGSIQTVVRATPEMPDVLVSIPLWFDSNYRIAVSIRM